MTEEISFDIDIHPDRIERGEPVVHIDRLSIALPEGADRPYAVDRVSFRLHPGKCCASSAKAAQASQCRPMR